MIVSLSEKEIKNLIRYNKKELSHNPIRKSKPLTDPYTYWVDETGKGINYHCAICGHKTHEKLEQCPCCKADVLDLEYSDVQRYTLEIE